MKDLYARRGMEKRKALKLASLVCVLYVPAFSVDHSPKEKNFSKSDFVSRTCGDLLVV
jgi:hypothetical protein